MKKARNILGKALVFGAGSSACAAELSRIKEIVRSRHIEPLPNSSQRIAGIINVRGEIIPVLSGKWCGMPEDLPHSGDLSYSILLLQFQGEIIGVAIKHVKGIEDIHAYDLGSLAEMEGSPLKNLISCSVLLSNSGAVPLLDVKLIIEYLKSGDPSAQSEPEKKQAVYKDGTL